MTDTVCIVSALAGLSPPKSLYNTRQAFHSPHPAAVLPSSLWRWMDPSLSPASQLMFPLTLSEHHSVPRELTEKPHHFLASKGRFWLGSANGIARHLWN